MNSFKSLLFTAVCIFFAQTAFSQSTFEDIYEMMQVKCAGCHGGSSPAGALDLSLSQQEVYDALVGAAPVNPAAAANNYELVKAGYPDRSFLLHKIATQDWDAKYGLETAEGDVMPPNNLPALVEKEIELVRQWILFGAPMNETVVDPQLLEDYYENGLALNETTPIDPPAAGEGFQLEFGPIFLAPLEEREFYIKDELPDLGNYEVSNLDIAFNDESHHFILYKMDQQLANTRPDGLRDVEVSETSMFQNTLVAAWQNPVNYALPQGTAYKMQNGTVYDLNYHIKNYSVTGVLAGKVYVNVYTQETGTAQEEMYSQLFPISLFDMFQGAPLGSGLVVPADGEEHVFTEHLWIPPVQNLPWPGGTWHIWQLSTHTHARGVDYDIYLAEGLNGDKGEQVYEGFYNYNYTFNQGYYDWEHPAVRIFDELLPVNMGFGGGLIHEAKYVNNEDETKVWGNTTDDEMMLIFVHFTTNPITPPSSTENLSEKFELSIFPNPTTDISYLKYDLDQSAHVEIAIYDLQGKNKWQRNLGQQASGTNVFEFSKTEIGLPSGIYFVECKINGEGVTRKLVVE